jgi:hypothetical protein
LSAAPDWQLVQAAPWRPQVCIDRVLQLLPEQHPEAQLAEVQPLQAPFTQLCT